MKLVVVFVLLLIGGLCVDSQAATRRVMVDLSHSEQNVNAENNMVAIQTLLPDFSLSFNYQPLNLDTLNGFDAIMLYHPYTLLTDSDVNTLEKFVKDGGGLIVCGEHDIGWEDESRISYNEFTSVFGVAFQSNAVDDPTDKKGCYCTPVIHNLADHPLTVGVVQIVMYKPCSLQVSEDVVAVAWGDDDTSTIGADVIRGEDIVVVAAIEYGKGRIIFLGSNTPFLDSFINLPNNQEFSINCFQWVTENALPSSGLWDTVIVVVVVAGILLLLGAARGLRGRKKAEV
ncbi:MAG: hypothetical protein HXS41_10685 [Theionarchaea archaeon]|nr:hypothetical protein [Theionarchaea archaeon]MBU7000705.1 hypothetical protein [Theionarchaea archaeon]MBU7021512.1 hypothetical protein [Theionarchaea archaeon]MBU7033548.1 hypothetical protein [Theionarchaea archaeon]MBU7039643.1 hypothetical protein [Theionarchaea archaeon]